MKRSPILDAAERYWPWLGRLLADWTNQIFGPKRRSWFVCGGCLIWLLLIWVVVLVAILYATILLAVVAALGLFGVLLTIVGAIDQGRIAVLHSIRARRIARP